MLYSRIGLVPAAAPLQESVTWLLTYTEGDAVKVVGAVGRVFRRRELEFADHGEYQLAPNTPRARIR